jgi:hypothetical protein
MRTREGRRCAWSGLRAFGAQESQPLAHSDAALMVGGRLADEQAQQIINELRT